MTTHALMELAESVLHEYAAASGNDFGDHYNREAAIQWMQYALEKSGVGQLRTAAAEGGEAVAWAVIDHATGSPWTVEASQDEAIRLAETHDDTVRPLVYQQPLPATSGAAIQGGG